MITFYDLLDAYKLHEIELTRKEYKLLLDYLDSLALFERFLSISQSINLVWKDSNSVLFCQILFNLPSNLANDIYHTYLRENNKINNITMKYLRQSKTLLQKLRDDPILLNELNKYFSIYRSFRESSSEMVEEFFDDNAKKLSRRDDGYVHDLGVDYYIRRKEHAPQYRIIVDYKANHDIARIMNLSIQNNKINSLKKKIIEYYDKSYIYGVIIEKIDTLLAQDFFINNKEHYSQTIEKLRHVKGKLEEYRSIINDGLERLMSQFLDLVRKYEAKTAKKSEKQGMENDDSKEKSFISQYEEEKREELFKAYQEYYLRGGKKDLINSLSKGFSEEIIKEIEFNAKVCVLYFKTIESLENTKDESMINGIINGLEASLHNVALENGKLMKDLNELLRKRIMPNYLIVYQESLLRLYRTIISHEREDKEEDIINAMAKLSLYEIAFGINDEEKNYIDEIVRSQFDDHFNKVIDDYFSRKGKLVSFK